MALENQPVFQAPSLPKMGKDSSPLMKGAKTIDNSFTKPKLKASKMSFVRAKKVEASTEKLKKENTTEIQGTGSIATALVETNSILVEIQKQLALDFANRIAERKGNLITAKKKVRKKKLVEKEEFVERGKGLATNIKSFGSKVLKPVRSIFEKLLDFLAIVGTGLVLNTAWEWLSKEENRQKLLDVFNFIGQNWALIGTILGGAIIAKGLAKLYKVFDRLRKIIRFLKGPKIKPPTQSPADFCQQVLKCIQGGPVYNAIKNRLFEDPDFTRLIPGLPILPPTLTGQQPAEKPDDEPVSGDPPQVPVFNINDLLDKIPGTHTPAEAQFLIDNGYDNYVRGGRTQDPVTDFAAFAALFAAVKTAPIWGPALLTQAGRLKNVFVKPQAIPQTQTALQQAASKSLQRTGQAAVQPQQALATVRGRVIQRPAGMSDKGYQELVRKLRLQGGRSSQTTRPIRDRVTDRSADRIRDAASNDPALKSLDKGQQLQRQFENDSLLERLVRDMTGRVSGRAKGGLIGKSQGGLIPGAASMKDTIPALLAQGEFVINSMSTKLFKPFLFAINDNAGKMFAHFIEAIREIKKNVTIDKEITEVQNKLFGKFDEMIEEMDRRAVQEKLEKLSKEKEKDPELNVGGGILSRIKPVKRETPTKIQTYSRGRGGPSARSGSSSPEGKVTTINMTKPAINLAGQQTPEEPPIQPTESASAQITIRPFDKSNRYIMNNYEIYGIVV